MSLKPVRIIPTPFFSPIGSTPAKCLTQFMSPEEDATLLLLNSRDLRDILFTAYNQSNSDSRKLDFTCCEDEAEAIARNIIILSFIIDDTSGARVRPLWNLYYHVFVDREDSILIQLQAKKILDYTQSLAKWERGPYGTLIRFCDTTTFSCVVKVWKLYAVDSSDWPRYKDVQESVKTQWEAAKREQKKRACHNEHVLNGVQSSAPLHCEAFRATRKQHKKFWESGTCFKNKDISKTLTFANPMFLTRHSHVILHYNTNPLHGFHLSLGHAQLLSETSLKVGQEVRAPDKTVPKIMRVAVTQFEAWCNTFRALLGRVVIRFVHADAIAFCHVLQHHRAHKESHTAKWYRSNWSFSSLVLDSKDYEESGHAPTSFNMIDASDIADHLGSLNVIAASAPLLHLRSSSNLRMETRLQGGMASANSVEELLGGDFKSVSLLLGLKSAQYWSNATAIWHFNDYCLKALPFGDDQSLPTRKLVILWQPVKTAEVKYAASDLAKFVYNFYLAIFHDEDRAQEPRKLPDEKNIALSSEFRSCEMYSRATLAVILRQIKRTCVVDWVPFIKTLMHSIESAGSLHYQSLLVHLDNLGLYALEELSRSPVESKSNMFRRWMGMPSIVCISLVVPRSVIAMFNDIEIAYERPLCQLQLHSSTTQSSAIYTDIQLGYGNVTASGTAFTSNYRIHVEEDAAGCHGNSPLIVSAMISSSLLVGHGDNDAGCDVLFGLKSPSSNLYFTSTLATRSPLHTSSIGQKDVFVTRFRPNMIGQCADPCMPAPLITADRSITVMIQPRFDSTMLKISSLKIQYDIKSLDMIKALQKTSAVMIQPSSPYGLVVKVGNRFRKDMELPLPLNHDEADIKFGCKFPYIQYCAPIIKSQQLAFRPESVFPVLVKPWPEIQLGHLHYVSSDLLPKLDLIKTKANARWLKNLAVTEATMSKSEFTQYMKAPKDPNKTGQIVMKETIHSMFSYLLEIQKPGRDIGFTLRDKDNEFVILFVDGVRMDISNQTAFIDAACVSLHDQMSPQFFRALLNNKNMDIVVINPTFADAPFWKHLLPAYAERCRKWKHKARCEYKAQGRIPLSTESDQRYMCNCGHGVFPAGYLSNWNEFHNISKLAVRVAIPVIFHSPISPESALPGVLHGDRHIGSCIDGVDTAKESCFGCGTMDASHGMKLNECHNCNSAQHRSVKYQKKDRKGTHGGACNQLNQKHSRV